MSCQKKPLAIRSSVNRAESPAVALASAAFVLMATVAIPSQAADDTKKTKDAKADATQLEGVTAEATQAAPGSNPNADPEAPYKVDKSANTKLRGTGSHHQCQPHLRLLIS